MTAAAFLRVQRPVESRSSASPLLSLLAPRPESKGGQEFRLPSFPPAGPFFISRRSHCSDGSCLAILRIEVVGDVGKTAPSRAETVPAKN